ncbi:M57 family metalloprotease [Aquimarina aggregata]|uniref:M57 family metalloprotease n=1 Tax=Aquimarina aggregata TaxID=1642818 RepID=UPI0024915DF5|nr:M57 family metalloprotease [Aquimarina aggregata]
MGYDIKNTPPVKINSSDINGYLVEGDVILDNDQIYQSKNNFTKQRRAANLISCKNVGSIRVRIDLPSTASLQLAYDNSPNLRNLNLLNSAKQIRAQLQKAIQIWNKSSNVNMRIVTGKTDMIVRFQTGNSSARSAGRANPPKNGKPGRIVEINPFFGGTDSGRPESKATRSTLIHEIGHALGLNHTNLKRGSLISGTPNKDFNSIMHSDPDIFHLKIVSLSNGDKKAIKKLYGPTKNRLCK